MTYKLSDLSQRSPDMDEAAFAEFVADIKERGQLVPIVVSGEEVIDGRKRLTACQRLGIEPKVVDLGTQDAGALARSLNILRTHYTAGQRAMFAARSAPRRQRPTGLLSGVNIQEIILSLCLRLPGKLVSP